MFGSVCVCSCVYVYVRGRDSRQFRSQADDTLCGLFELFNSEESGWMGGGEDVG